MATVLNQLCFKRINGRKNVLATNIFHNRPMWAWISMIERTINFLGIRYFYSNVMDLKMEISFDCVNAKRVTNKFF